MKRDIFNAIADPTRRGILLSLVNERQNINSLADKYAISRQAVSLHIKYLKECGVISIKKEGRERYCSLESQKLTEVVDWLKPFEKMWTGKLDQLGTLLEEMQSMPKSGSSKINKHG